MALQINLPDTNVGLPAPAAYARIVGVQVDVLRAKVHVAVNVYATRDARLAERNPVAGGVYEADFGPAGVDPDGSDGLRTNAYSYLKSLPDFAGAQDV